MASPPGSPPCSPRPLRTPQRPRRPRSAVAMEGDLWEALGRPRLNAPLPLARSADWAQRRESLLLRLAPARPRLSGPRALWDPSHGARPGQPWAPGPPWKRSVVGAHIRFGVTKSPPGMFGGWSRRILSRLSIRGRCCLSGARNSIPFCAFKKLTGRRRRAWCGRRTWASKLCPPQHAAALVVGRKGAWPSSCPTRIPS